MLRIATDLDLVKADEGFRAAIYDDKTGRPIVPGSLVEGHPTIGWGVRLDGGGITPPEAEALFQSRMARARGDAAEVVGIGCWSALTQARRAALTNMAYALGREGLAEFAAMLNAVRMADWSAAKAGVLNSKWAQEEAPARARRVAEMLLTGDWPASA